MKIGYARINPTEENFEELLEKFKSDNDLQRVYWDKISVKEKERPEYDRMMDYLRAGDELFLMEFARFNKTLIELVKTIEQLNERGIKVISEKENFDSSTEEGKIKFDVLKSAAEFEKTLIKQRQKEGIAAARASGKYKGYNEKEIPKDFEDFKDLYNMREMSVADIAKHYDVSKPTIYKWIKQTDDEETDEQSTLSNEPEIAEELEIVEKPIIPDELSIYDEPEITIERLNPENTLPSPLVPNSEIKHESRLSTSKKKSKSSKKYNTSSLPKRKTILPEDFEAYRKMYHKGILTVSDIAIANKVTSQTIRRWLKLADAETEAKELKREERARKKAEKNAEKSHESNEIEDNLKKRKTFLRL